MEVTRKAMAANEVYLLSSASNVLPLFLPKKVSAPPAMEPDKPACLPDCNNTITIIDNANKICSILTITLSATKDNTSYISDSKSERRD